MLELVGVVAKINGKLVFLFLPEHAHKHKTQENKMIRWLKQEIKHK